MNAICVVRIGGSLANSPQLAAWLAAIEAQAGRVVVVPGGGPFADAVRDTQPVMGFDDVAAHRMAVLAMEQYAHALASLSPGLSVAASKGEIRSMISAGRVPVWLPTAMVLADPALPATWAVTSDSLAAWLARDLGARRMVLVKSVDPPSGSTTAGRLAAAGMVDGALDGLLAGWNGEAWFAGPDSHGLLGGIVAGEASGMRSCARIRPGASAPVAC